MRPLDLQVNLAQTVNVAEFQQARGQQVFFQQDHLSVKAVEETKQRQEQVQNIEKDSDTTKVEKDKGGKGGGYFGGGKRGNRKGKGQKNRDGNFDPVRGKFIDIVK
jgi:hypothetical protein